jgi:hypothetical protein
MALLNVKYGQLSTEIEMSDIKDMNDLLRIIKARYGNLLKDFDASQIRLYKSYPVAQIVIMEDVIALPNEYFLKGGPCIEIKTLPAPSIQPSVKKISPFVPRTHTYLEGLPGSAMPKISRSNLVSKISETMKNHMSLLITSPTFTGKTSLANLMYDHWDQQGKTVNFISLGCYAHDQDLNEYFKQRLGQNIDNLLRSEGYLIMDSTWIIYSHPDFWENLNSEVQVCKVLAFGTCALKSAGSERSPSQFQLKWYFDDLKFTDVECQELVESFKEFVPFAREVLIPEVLGDLFKFLNNHPGLVYLSLHTLCVRFTEKPFFAKSVAEVLKLISQGELLYVLFTEARCFLMTYPKLSRLLGSDTDRILDKLITSDSVELSEDKLAELHFSGNVITDSKEKELWFPHGLMRVFYRNVYYRARLGLSRLLSAADLMDETIHSVLIRILKGFNLQVLTRKQLVGEDDQKYERELHDEFYRCCFFAAPRDFHPEVSHLYASNGFLDFYIGGEQQWGFELRRNGVRMNRQSEIFDLERGLNKQIPLTDHAVIDFCDSLTDGTVPAEKYYKVVVSDDLKTIHLFQGGTSEEIECIQTQ